MPLEPGTTTLPDGTIVDVVVDDEDDDMNDQERPELHDALQGTQT